MNEDEWLDAQIDDVLAGAGRADSDPTVMWLASAARTTPSTELVRRIDGSVRGRAVRSDRPGRLLSIVALGLAAVFVFQALSNVIVGDWIAENLGEPHGPHAYFEGALAMTAAAVCAAAAAVRRSWAGVSVLSATPLALSLGIHGVGELGQFAAGAVLHTTGGALGLLLAWAWWRESHQSRRDTRAQPDEGETWAS